MKSLKITPAVICFALLILFGLVNTLSVFRMPVSDFGNYYYGARLIGTTSASADFLNNVGLFNDYAQLVGRMPVFLNHCTVSPQTDFLYLPFVFFEEVLWAKCVFNWVSIILFVGVLFRFLKKYSPEPDVKTMLILIAAIIPAYYNIIFGQTYLIITALMMIMILCLEKHKWLAGLSLAIAITLKISPAIFLVWLISEKRFRIIGWTVLFWCIITALTLLFYMSAIDAFTTFYTDSMPRMMNGFVSDPYSSSFQGFIVFLRKLMLPDTILNPDALINGSERLIQLINTLFFILISFILVGAWKNALDWRKKILLLLLLVNITSGYTSTYSLLLLVPFISFGNSVQDWMRMMLYGMVMVLPPRILDGYSPFLEEYKLWIFIALFIMESKPSFGFRRIEKPQLVLATIFMVVIVFKFAQRPESLPLKYYKPDLVTQHYVLDAAVIDNKLYYISFVDDFNRQYGFTMEGAWSGMEENEPFALNGVRLKRIGSDGENYLVLSDYHRGPGLFHLYTISKWEFEAIAK